MTSEEVSKPETAAPVSGTKPEAPAVEPKSEVAATKAKPSGDAAEKPEKQKPEVAEKPEADTKEPEAKAKRGRGAPRRKAAAVPAEAAPSPAREGMRRDRKKVERLSEVIDKQYKLAEETRVVYPEGSGAHLKDCPRVAYFISLSKPEELKLLHSLIFNRTGKANEIRKNLLEFNGFEFDEESKEYQKLVEKAASKKQRDLKKTLYVLDLDRSAGLQKQLAERICKFLLKPSDNGKAPPQKPAMRPQRGRKRKSTANKAAASSGSDDNIEEEDEKMIESDEKSSSDEEEEAPKKKRARRKSPAKKRAAAGKKKSPGRRGRPAKRKPSSDEDEPSSLSEDEPEDEEEEEQQVVKQKKEAAADANANDEEKSADDDSAESEQDDVPLKQLKKQGKPTDKELKSTVSDLLDGADMDSITINGIINQVFAKYEGVDLSDRKDFLRETIKQALV